MNTSFAPLALDAVAFLSERTGIEYGFVDFTQPNWLCATARTDDGAIGGVAACEFKEWFDVHFSCAIDPRRMERAVRDQMLAAIFRALFSRAVRVTALVAPDNRLAIAGALRMGFVYEGYRRLGVEGKRDALTFGMLASDCRFLPGVKPTAAIASFPLGERRHGLLA